VDHTFEGFEDPVSAAGVVRNERGERAPLWKRLLFGGFVAAAVLFFAAVMLYRFGSMWTPAPEVRAQYEQLVAAGQAAQVPTRFHIPIPGCVCHSDDPVLTMQHSNRRISECSGCHAGAGPTQ
jgi:hypothetical protein